MRGHESLRADRAGAGLLAHVDLLADGPFLLRRQDPDLVWRGSSNQRLIRLSDRFRPEDLRSRANGGVVVGPDRVLLHGIGTQALVRSRAGGPLRQGPPGSQPGPTGAWR